MKNCKVVSMIMIIAILASGCNSDKKEVESPAPSETPAAATSPTPTSVATETPEVTAPTEAPLDIADDAKQLFTQYSWTIDHKVTEISVVLPNQLVYNAGDFPSVIYWTYNNTLSAHIGLDMSGYTGHEVTAEVYALNEPIPERKNNTFETRGIVIRSEDDIIGAFIDAGRHYSFACALDRTGLEDITGGSWDAWVDGIINYDDPLEKELALLSPEEVIEAYYNAIDSKDFKRAIALETLAMQSQRLSTNIDNSKQIYNDETALDFNLNSVKVISIEMIKYDDLKNAWMYKATLDMDFISNMFSNDGVVTRYLFLKQETERSGWKISEIGTGP